MTRLPDSETTHNLGNIDDLVSFVEMQKPLCVITGAGCSTDSGIFDYRGEDGAWKRPPPVQLDEFLRTETARRKYWARSMLGWPRFHQARPNVAHRSLVRLETAGLIQSLVTQNVDDLHEIAGQRQVVRLHGSLATASCLSCSRKIARQEIQGWLESANQKFLRSAVPVDAGGESVYAIDIDDSFQVPMCPICGGTLKPDVVFFGGSIPTDVKDAARDAVLRANGLLSIGSSLMVYSSFRLVKEATSRRKRVAVLGRGLTRADELASLRVRADIGHAIGLLTSCLLD